MPINLGALLGGNQGSGGLAPYLQQLAAQHAANQRAQQIKDAFGRMQQSMQPGAPSVGGQPGPMPASAASDPQNIMSNILSSAQGIQDPVAASEFLDKAGMFTTPFEKMQTQLEMKRQQIDNASQMLNVRMDEMDRVARIRAESSMYGADSRASTAERGQDIRSSDTRYGVDTRADTAERGQDVRSGDTRRGQDLRTQDNTANRQERGREADQRDTTQNRNITSRAVQAEQSNKIKQQNADTAADRAGTYKYSVFSKEQQAKDKLAFQKQSLEAKNATIRRGQDMNYQARMQRSVNAGSPQLKNEFAAAKSEYSQAEADYRNTKMSPSSSVEDINAAADTALKAMQRMESIAARADAGAAKPTAAPAASPAREKIKPGEEVRKDPQGNLYVLRDGKPVLAEQ